MKTAIYIEDGLVQLVITPTNVFERNALSIFQEKPLKATIYAGSFYDCQGGWIQQQDGTNYYGCDKDDNSLIITMKEDEGSGE